LATGRRRGYFGRAFFCRFFTSRSLSLIVCLRLRLRKFRAVDLPIVFASPASLRKALA
jgi:hypothetical protein